MKIAILATALSLASFNCFGYDGLATKDYQDYSLGSYSRDTTPESSVGVENEVFYADWTGFGTFVVGGTYPGSDIVTVYYLASYADAPPEYGYIELRGGGDFRYISIDPFALSVQFTSSYQGKKYEETLLPED
ncbi:hypothetical protein [Pinirhizobacter soli]|uniref:hypothetical protein n=1 Tax=Pinirhizobacter soli TaxID=2786953 RepID=UPI00202A3A08|nr:hypothetical protein [Pinirhizobacter soli]